MTDTEVLHVWNALSDRRKIEARVYSCAVSAYENDEEIDRVRAAAVLHLIWPGVALGNVPYQIWGRTSEQSNNSRRQADFARLMQIIRSRSQVPAESSMASLREDQQRPDGGSTPTLPAFAAGEADVLAAEGRELLRLHRTRERNRGLVARKKRSVLSKSKRLVCEVCNFDFADVYGPRGEGFAECHHVHPISQSAPGRRTRLSELAVVCSNCHRMLHRRPWVSVSELRELVWSLRGR